MKKHFLLLSMTLGFFSVRCQSSIIDEIDQKVHQIDSRNNMTVTVLDANEVYPQTFDGGGVIKIYIYKNESLKIVQELFTSFGKLTTIAYLNNGTAIKIIDKEENFLWSEDLASWDLSKLKPVFQADIYIFNWDMDDTKTVKKGKRKMSEGSCSIMEYKSLIELGQTPKPNGTKPIKTNMKQNPIADREEAIEYVIQNFSETEETLWLSDSLNDNMGVNMAIILDYILKAGYMPDGFEQKGGYRVYKYKKED